MRLSAIVSWLPWSGLAPRTEPGPGRTSPASRSAAGKSPTRTHASTSVFCVTSFGASPAARISSRTANARSTRPRRASPLSRMLNVRVSRSAAFARSSTSARAAARLPHRTYASTALLKVTVSNGTSAARISASVLATAAIFRARPYPFNSTA
jgi:hypothetical protein